MKEQLTLDCTNLPCPQPVIKTRNTLAEMSGRELTVIVDNEAAVANVSRFAESQGHTVELRAKGASFYLFVKKGKEKQAVRPESVIECGTGKVKKKNAVYISANLMGHGPEELGKILMTAFFESITHLAGEISQIILVNSAVKLATEESEALHHLQELEKTGIEIMVCGTCLNFFKIKEPKAGTVSNMYAILEAMSKADKVISP